MNIPEDFAASNRRAQIKEWHATQDAIDAARRREANQGRVLIGGYALVLMCLFVVICIAIVKAAA